MLNIVTVQIFGAPCLCSGCRYGTNSTVSTIRTYWSYHTYNQNVCKLL